MNLMQRRASLARAVERLRYEGAEYMDSFMFSAEAIALLREIDALRDMTANDQGPALPPELTTQLLAVYDASDAVVKAIVE